eukprot:TRINITY_DN31397_c0_g3_i1.p1 TRINITY_DN31397_c0_g3~~TRINITY_DN31397_c0_g3_i1.p1  ORF type:complete len:2064 (+),score=309.17 TRINITY_DN31397_c0_g3_i1:916-6192(+)
MLNLKAPLSLSQHASESLSKLDGTSLNNLPEILKELNDEADTLIGGMVNKELEDWASAKTDARGWPETFAQHLNTANKLRHLSPKDVSKAVQRLTQKVIDWQNDCLLEARKAAEYDDNWQDFIEYAVRKGMDFEESSLFDLMHCRQQFRPLMNMQAEKWQKEAAADLNTAKLATWRKLTALTAALAQLGEKDTRTVKLHKDIIAARAPLDAALNDGESRFLRALQEKRYRDAVRLLGGTQDRSRHLESLKEELGEAVEVALTHLNDDAEVEDMVRVAKEARGLIQDFDKLQEIDADLLVPLQIPFKNLKDVLARKAADASEELQSALEGRRPPTRALAICGALSGKSRAVMAEEALSKFTDATKKAFDGMSCLELVTWIIRHEGAYRAMPEELASKTSAYEDLIEKFSECLKDSFKKEMESLQSYQDQHEWAKAKQLFQQLLDAIDSILELDVVKAFKSQFRNLKSSMGVGGVTRTKYATQEIEIGHFNMAIWALVTGDGNDTQEICEAINVKLAENMNVLAADKASLHQRLSILKSFLDAVGEHPPDELRSLWREVRSSYMKTKPLVDEQAWKAVEAGLEAASDSDLDLNRLARALVDFRHFESAVEESKKRQLDHAIQQFWQRVKFAVKKVGKDIEELEVQSLALNLEPLRQWLQSFSRLSPEETQLLLERLQSGVADLQMWMREVLADQLANLVDADQVQSQIHSRCFGVVSRRCKVAEKLHPVLNTACIDLTPAKAWMLQAKEAALSALNHGPCLQEFNKNYKFLKVVSSELPEIQFNSHLDEVDRVFREKVLDAHVRNIARANSIPDALKAIIDLRTVANDAPDTYHDVTSRLQIALSNLQNSPLFHVRGIILLGCQLGQHHVGRLVIAEHPHIFGAAKDQQNNLLFRRAGETNKLEDVVGRLTRESCLGTDEYRDLMHAFQQYEHAFGMLLSKRLMQGKPIETVEQEAKVDLNTAVNGSSPNFDSCILLLAHLAECYTIVKCGKEFIEAPVNEKNDWFVKPHRAQLLTIFRLLQIHKMSNSSSMWRWLSGCPGSKTPENHLAQVLTGEGKCLTLGLLAAFFALKGVESDIVCYRKFLTEQDRQAMLPFYDFVGVAKQVRYVTFDELCQERLESIKTASKELLLTGETPQIRHLRDVSGRALLIDEVDVLFGRRFYGQTWDGGFKLDSPEAVALTRFVFEQKRLGCPITDIVQTQPFNDLLMQSPTEMHQALTGVAMILVRSIEDWATPEPILNEKTCQIGYKDKDEINYDLSYYNKTVFAYLSFEMEGKITSEEAAKHLGLDLLCGRFSFAEFPKQYCCILGVTGTLRELLSFQDIRWILEREYGFKHFTYTPSIFGERRLNFREAEHVSVLDNEADWISRIESLIDDETKVKNSVLVFFKNETEMKKFPGWSDLECLTERADPERRAGYVAAATAEGRVTLLTRAFGRGIDFQMPEGHQVVVLQTFLPSLISEETQIKGRTARQGKPGQYRLVLCGPHLEAKMGFRPEEVQSLKSGNGEEIKRLLAMKQQQRTVTKAAGMSQRKEKAAKLEQDTKAWENLLFKSDVAATLKLQKLAEWNGNEIFQEVHYTVLLDYSGSMAGQPWMQLTKAFNSFREELLRDPAAAAGTTVSVILFNGSAHIVVPTHAKAAQVQDIGHHQASGGTSFNAAFDACRTVIGRSPPYAKELILFLTDGAASVPVHQIVALLADHKSRIKSLTCVAFGGGADASSLKWIGHLFEAEHVVFELTSPGDQASLVQTFVEAAKSRAIHI